MVTGTVKRHYMAPQDEVLEVEVTEADGRKVIYPGSLPKSILVGKTKAEKKALLIESAKNKRIRTLGLEPTPTTPDAPNKITGSVTI